MANTKLNERIAEWHGFTKIEPKEWFQPNRKYLCWVYPNKLRMSRLPQFTSSMDAILKWVVPKLKITVQIYYEIYDDGNRFSVSLDEDCSLLGVDDSLPMAFCLALEKYIDAQGDK